MAINTQIYQTNWRELLNKAIDIRSAKVVPDGYWKYVHPYWLLFAPQGGVPRKTWVRVGWDLTSNNPADPYDVTIGFFYDVALPHNKLDQYCEERIKRNLSDPYLDELLQLAEIKYMMGEA